MSWLRPRPLVCGLQPYFFLPAGVLRLRKPQELGLGPFRRPEALYPPHGFSSQLFEPLCRFPPRTGKRPLLLFQQRGQFFERKLPAKQGGGVRFQPLSALHESRAFFCGEGAGMLPFSTRRLHPDPGRAQLLLSGAPEVRAAGGRMSGRAADRTGFPGPQGPREQAGLLAQQEFLHLVKPAGSTPAFIEVRLQLLLH